MPKDQLKIAFTGDLCPHLRIEKLAIDGDYKAVFNDFQKEFEGNDLNVIDLECPLTEEITTIEKSGPHQKAHPKTIHLLKEIKVGMVAMANNHILDYGAKALSETIDLCTNNGITTIGVGKDLDAARLPVIKEIKGKKIGFLNFCESEWTIATDDSPGANPMDLIENYYAIQSLKQSVDKIIIIAHGGIEFYHLPSPRIKKTYRYFIDAGADAVISHHTHCFSGYEVYKEAPIFYGLGNFVYDWPDKENDNWNFGYMVRLSIGDRIGFEIIPFRQNNGDEIGVHYLSEVQDQQFLERLKELNSIIADDHRLKAAFDKLCKEKAGIYKLYFEPYRGKIWLALRVRKLLPDLFSRRKKLFQTNIIRCESHRDIMLSTLENEIKKKQD